MSKQIDALKLALEALEDMHIVDFPLENLHNWNKAIKAIKEALAQPEQEPMAWAVMKDGECLSVRRFEPAATSHADGVQFVPLYTTPPQRKPQLTVRIRSYPESNGKRNWTAMFVRTEPFDGLVGNSGGVTIDRGECWNRVAYNAERARFLLGERTTEPSILEYGKDVKTPEEWEGKDSEAAHNIKE